RAWHLAAGPVPPRRRPERPPRSWCHRDPPRPEPSLTEPHGSGEGAHHPAVAAGDDCPVDPERAADTDGLDTRYERVPLLTTGGQNQMGIDQFRPLAVTRCDLADSRLRQREQGSAVGPVEKVEVVGTE